MITNKEQFKDRENIYLILDSLERAIESSDDFSVMVLITRLERFNLKIVCIDDQPVVQ